MKFLERLLTKEYHENPPMSNFSIPYRSAQINLARKSSNPTGTILGCVVCLFAEEREIGLVTVMLEQPLEGGADGAFVLLADSFVFFQLSVVGFDGFVCGFDVEHDLSFVV